MKITVSLALRELIPHSSAVDSLPESEVSAFFHWLHNEKIMAQYILFSVDEIKHYYQLLNRGGNDGVKAEPTA